MANRFTVPAVLLAATFGGLMSTQLFTSPPAQACPDGQQEDPLTRMCWSQNSQGISSGGPCTPGQIGNCIGRIRPNPLQNPGPPPVVAHPCQDSWSYCDGGKYW